MKNGGNEEDKKLREWIEGRRKGKGGRRLGGEEMTIGGRDCGMRKRRGSWREGRRKGRGKEEGKRWGEVEGDEEGNRWERMERGTEVR
jgi:hypothetical protein